MSVISSCNTTQNLHPEYINFFYTRTGSGLENQIPEAWLFHMHPHLQKLLKELLGYNFKLAELYLPGLGGETTGPVHKINARRKVSVRYVWSIIDTRD